MGDFYYGFKVIAAIWADLMDLFNLGVLSGPLRSFFSAIDGWLSWFGAFRAMRSAFGEIGKFLGF